MIKIKTAVLAAAVALGVAGYSARATTIIIPSTTVTWTSSSQDLNITYEVDYDDVGTYTYTYILSSAEAITSFTIAPTFTQGAAILANGSAISAGVYADSIIWVWAPGVTGATVSFTSPLGPTFGNASANDTGVSWQAPPLIPVPVPEASTIMAGALMLLPLGFGAFRALRKERAA